MCANGSKNVASTLYPITSYWSFFIELAIQHLFLSASIPLNLTIFGVNAIDVYNHSLTLDVITYLVVNEA